MKLSSPNWATIPIVAFFMMVVAIPIPAYSVENTTPFQNASPSTSTLPLAEDVTDPRESTESEHEELTKHDRITGSIGLGSVVVPRFEGGSKYIAVPYIPIRLNYKGLQLQTRGLGLEADLVPSRIVDAGPIIQARLGRNGVGDSRIDALSEVNTAMEVGGYVQINSPPLLKKKDNVYLRLSAVQDVVGAHGGAILETSTGYSIALTDKLRAGAGVSTSFASQDFMSSYFTVSPGESTLSGISAYQAGSGIKDVGANVNLNYKITPKWGIAAVGGYTRLLGDAAESSIAQEVGNRNRLFAGLFTVFYW